MCRALQNQCQRAGPEFLGERICRRRDVARPVRELRGVGDVYDQRVILRAALGGENFFDGFGVGRIGTKAVDGFGRKSNEASGAQGHYGSLHEWCIQQIGRYFSKTSIR